MNFDNGSVGTVFSIDGTSFVKRNGVEVPLREEMQLQLGDVIKSTENALVVISTVEAVRAASCDIHQTVMRGDEILTEARVTAAFVSPDGKARRQPATWVAAFQPIIHRPAE